MQRKWRKLNEKYYKIKVCIFLDKMNKFVQEMKIKLNIFSMRLLMKAYRDWDIWRLTWFSLVGMLLVRNCPHAAIISVPLGFLIELGTLHSFSILANTSIWDFVEHLYGHPFHSFKGLKIKKTTSYIIFTRISNPCRSLAKSCAHLSESFKSLSITYSKVIRCL